jgi:acyl-CoA reductase-like NAD-dependent aldehyde dehydrogenase
LEAGLLQDVVQVVHTDQQTTLKALVADPRVNFVAFTGSVAGGKAVAEATAAGKGFKGVALELGGKDAAYVRSDADLSKTVGALVDGKPPPAAIRHRLLFSFHVQFGAVM